MIKPFLSKVNFFLGNNPEIQRNKDWQNFIPDGYQSVLLISADFELAWAWRYTKSTTTPLQKALKKAQLERENVPKIINLCEQYNIPITWATVGHLFLDSCKNDNGLPHSNLPRLRKFENDYWKFEGEDWFEYDPCTNYKEAPCWYAPDLIKKILNSEVDHEIACHTFSHIDCREEVCTAEIMYNELKECQDIAYKWGIEMESFVHPGHTIGNLDTLSKQGFTNYRTNYRNVLGYPQKHPNGLWEFEQTTEFTIREGWSIDYHIYRYKTIIKRAIANNSICVLWFHPSFDSRMVELVWPILFDFLANNSDDIWITTHQKYVAYLNENHV